MTDEAKAASELVARLAALGVELYAEGERLLCRGPRRVITRELQAELALRKRSIIEQLRAAAATAQDAPLPCAQDAPLSHAQER
jgi:hypothetical protein